jgi:hypothetical protein
MKEAAMQELVCEELPEIEVVPDHRWDEPKQQQDFRRQKQLQEENCGIDDQ